MLLRRGLFAAGRVSLLLLMISFDTGQSWPWSSHHGGHSTTTLNPLYENYTKVFCYFFDKSCHWENVGGGDHVLTWKARRHYMHLDMDHAEHNATGRLASPWLSPLEHGAICHLHFRYYIPSYSYKHCQLSLLRQTLSQGDERIWATQNGTGFLTFSDPLVEMINCTGERFRIVFEGKGSCRVLLFNEINVNAIGFIAFSEHMSTMESLPPMTQYFTIDQTYTGTIDTMAPDSTTRGSGENGVTEPHVDEKDDDDDDDDDKSGLDTGALAGIIIAVIIVIVVVIVIILLVVVLQRRRRRERDVKSDRDSTDRNLSLAVTNLAYELNSEAVTGNNRKNGTTLSGGDTVPEENSHYDVPHLPPSPPPYESLDLPQNRGVRARNAYDNRPVASADDADDGAYNRLGVSGETGGGGMVGRNVYDHAKGDNYDRLHEESRKRRLERQLAHDDYSHTE